ncbi:hypothetical protein [Solemya velum gill symbiont]|uniref:Uncharacterized protein n=1 Tax=Solemya velum gill symbiont TaxID=2340 RepID=A0A0B0HFT5_SOVGS|nr:hypothetical protein [Solemya velum gill symbiont]KHF26321.1 hypothetical protein JV46_22070 [Solemya velum gill symbiont]OOY35589.1 hypothetical protein BOV88_04950 [Solemya velum gill symbiont]OOY38454.1 hypothetical protein BOV89_01220 [Solemya velum gill symbiont]OOY39733.1 hypothetical protein BOV90_07850 [Solemya velum gill symbiont]OOY43322.1 hypothetical protein BOV91_04345 [Solemya velum gill symbiont]
MEDKKNNFKVRELAFDPAHPDPDQVQAAALSLADITGILEVHVTSTQSLRVHYELLEISLEQIETGLIDAGFHLSNKLMHKIKRALHYYTEEVERANQGCAKGNSNCTRKVFIEHYRHGQHGCRDHRPNHWRHYL